MVEYRRVGEGRYPSVVAKSTPRGVAPLGARSVFCDELWVLFSHPLNKLLDLRIVPQRLEGVEDLEQLAFGEERVDLGVTDAMNPERLTSPEGLGDDVVFVDARSFDERSPTDRAGSYGVGGHEFGEVRLRSMRWAFKWESAR